jgi:hypothetical protein
MSMFALEPYYSWKTTGYNATLAIFYFPRSKVDALKSLKLNPNSALYEQQSEAAKTIMGMIDPSIPLEFNGNFPTGDSDSTSGFNGNNDDDNGNSNSGDNNGDAGSSSSSKAKASSVGIGVGVCAGAAAYGAGMFWVARRYRKRKQLHQRSSSTAEQMSQGSGAGSLFAAGARMSGSQRTGRSQMISAPVMAENSLGWN